MKKYFLFISLWGIAGSGLFAPFVSLASDVAVHSNNLSRDEETIEMHGHFAIGRMRSLVLPFEVTKSQSFITVHYLLSLSNIQVEIKDASGQPVYFDTVDAVANAELLISISNWEEGIYSLSFSDSSGGYIYGSFEVSD